MKIAHFSDTHLGYSRSARTDERGLNQRMVDVVETFQKVLDDIVASEADVVIHAGDFFDSIRPLNLVITAAYKRLVKFQRQRENKPLIIIAGNHDSPKSVGIGNILTIFGEPDQTDYSIPGVYVVESRARRIVLPDFGFEALALPWGGEDVSFEIKPENPKNDSVLIAHGIEQSLGIAGATLSTSRMNRERWSYVALGDFHIRKHIVDNVWYCGSTEFTSTNFWDEVESKGWLLVDTDLNEPTIRRVEPVRSAFTMDTIDAMGISGQEIGDQLLRNAHWDATTQPMVKQAVINCDVIARSEVPVEIRNELSSRALIYDLKMFLAPRSGGKDGTQAERGATLHDDWAVFAEDRQLALGVNRKEFVEAGHRTMREAEGDSQEN